MIVVGVLLPDKVVKKLTPCLTNDDDRVRFVRLDASRPLDTQPRVDVIVHKLAHDIAANRADGEGESPYIIALRAHLRDNPNIVAIESLRNAELLSDRAAMCLTLQAAIDVGYRMQQPRFAIARSGFAGDLVEAVDVAGLSYPLVIKPVLACGRADTHELALVTGREALLHAHTMWRMPVVAQELVEHDGYVLKGYVTGRYLHVSTRRSLPSARVLLSLGPRVITFDSQRPLPADCEVLRADEASRAFALSGGAAGAPYALPGVHIDDVRRAIGPVEGIARPAQRELGDAQTRVMRQVADSISDAFGGLHMFGFDVVIEEPTGEFHVVDLNALPHSAQTVPGLSQMFKDTCIRAHEHHTLVRFLRARWTAANANADAPTEAPTSPPTAPIAYPPPS